MVALRILEVGTPKKKRSFFEALGPRGADQLREFSSLA